MQPTHSDLDAAPRRSAGEGWTIALAAAACLLLALAMILNNQMSGEAVWFWYANAFDRGARIYADLHLPLQPLFVLETGAWVKLTGIRSWVYEIPALLHAMLLCACLGLLLRSLPRALAYAVGVGVLSGLSVATRLNDGTAMAFTAAFCALFLAHRAKLLCSLALLCSALLTVLLVAHLTGDTLRAYVSNSVVRAMGSKGGTGNFVWAPFLLLLHAARQLVVRRWILVYLAFLLPFTSWLTRRWQRGTPSLMALRVAGVFAGILIATPKYRISKLHGGLLDVIILAGIIATYVLGPIVLLRLARAQRERRSWDAREILLLIPLAEWFSSSASSSAEPLTQYYAPISMLLLLLAVLLPYARLGKLVRSEIAAGLAVVITVGIAGKAWVPYAWQNWEYKPMFTHRTWFQHPVYGPLYIDRDLLDFSLASCADVDGGHPLASRPPELLTLPYPYPNYFCGTPPWHGYVQTFFDTTQRSTMERLMQELNTAPPQWIIYQRQLLILTGAEKLYNHGRPLAQRDLDTMIFEKLQSGQWKLIERRSYLRGDGWYIIQTHP